MKKLFGISLLNKSILMSISEISSLNLDSIGKLQELLKDYNDMERLARKGKLAEIGENNSKTAKIYDEALPKLKIPMADDLPYNFAMLSGLIYHASSNFITLGIERLDSHVLKLSAISYDIVTQTDNCAKSINHSKNLKNNCLKLHLIRKDFENAHSEAISELFHYFKNSIDIVKYKEVYNSFMKIANKCNEIAYLLQKL